MKQCLKCPNIIEETKMCCYECARKWNWWTGYNCALCKGTLLKGYCSEWIKIIRCEKCCEYYGCINHNNKPSIDIYDDSVKEKPQELQYKLF